jgi:CHAT domain-containing protein
LGDVREHLAPRVVVVPHAELHAVPFHALSRDGRALLEDHEVVLAPSTAVFLHRLRAPDAPRAGGCLVLGVPDEAAPLIAREVESVRGLHAGARVRVGPAATRAALAREGRGARVVHVASHASFREDDPMQSGLLLGDGWLTLGEVHRLRLDAEVLVLSGCATGRSFVSEGEDLLGLLSGFLRAGAANLVTSLWRVSDASSARFMESFHRSLAAGAAPAAAIRAASLDVREAFPHPHDWAPFVLTGTGGVLPSSLSRSAA